MSIVKKNLIIFYTGEGKGKTTAALGIALRAIREKMKVIMIQFIKSPNESGEARLKKVLPGLEVKCFGRGFVFRKQTTISKKQDQFIDLPLKIRGKRGGYEDHEKIIKHGLNYAKKVMLTNRYQIIILDEIFVALNFGLVSRAEVVELIKSARRNNKFLILTGRGCPKSLYAYADLVSEMKNIKHPFDKGVVAIPGIDY